jgi:hypothetical protein
MAELKDHYQVESPSSERHVLSGTYSGADKPEVLFGNYPYLDRQEILSAMPSRPEMDKLVAVFCSNIAMVPGISLCPVRCSTLSLI